MVFAASAALTASLLGNWTGPATAATTASLDLAANQTSEPAPKGIPKDKRTEILGADYATSEDVAVTTSADATGFHILAANEADGYAFKTVATLNELGFDTDAWIGNACVTASGTRAAVAYAPRTFTNKPELMTRGAFTAIVDLATGKVTKLPHTATLGYFSPACGTGEDVVFSQFTDDDSKENATRLVRVDAATGKAAKPLKLAGQLTSAVPTSQGTYLAAAGANIVRVSQDGQIRTVAQTNAIPFQLTADATGGLTFIDRVSGGQAQVEHLSAGRLDSKHTKTKPQALAAGKLTGFDLARSADGQVIITGEAQTKAGSLPRTVKNPGGIAKGATISTTGEAAVSTAGLTAKQQRKDLETGPEAALPLHTSLTDLGTGNTAKIAAQPTPETDKTDPSPALGMPAGNSPLAAGDPNNPVEAERYCSVARNHPKKQAFQPTPRQVEWAVNQAISGHLNDWISRPADWKGTGMGAYSPQSLFPLKPLSGGGQIPAQIMLGITAQESNMWQATRFAVPGVTANSLIGNYYGIEYNPDGGQVDPWAIHWSKADCGYGITQVTDGMRMHGKEKPGEAPLTTAQQEAVALDYTANIAAGVNILVEKWNQTRNAGMTVNGGNPKYIENWFFALWAYNSGFYPESSAGDNYGHWGVGFTNNPANPLWKANRTPFLEGPDGKDDYSHAATPQHWPYPEKVIGWAARPISALFAPGDMQAGYRAAWWNSDFVRTQAKPPMGLFCDSSNHCDPSRIGENDSNDQGKGACLLDDPRMVDHLYCWWNTKVSWKDCGTAAACGNAIHRFNHTDYPEQPDANSYPPRCDTGLPSGTYVVDDLPSGTRPAGSTGRSCGAVSSAGSFEFTFTNWNNTYPGKIDTHQIGAGYGNHFYFAHTRNKQAGQPASSDGHRMYTTGTWTLNKNLSGWSKVYVHLPDHGAHTRQASYEVHGTDSSSPVRVKPQRVRKNKWVSLGAFKFTGTPKVSLSTHAKDGNGSEDVAWDAVAFQPLTNKPAHQIVAMGDSYASGEGVSNGNEHYYPESNYYDKTQPDTENKCHRSTEAWSRQATIPGTSASIGKLADDHNSNLDYQLVACSGARTYNVRSRSDGNSELPQLQQGYLDQHTTLVTIAIGGNDARFSDIITECVFAAGLKNCPEAEIGNKDPDTGEDVAGKTGPLLNWAPGWVRNEVRPRITTTLEEIHALAPNAKIVLMGYPILLENNGSCVVGISDDEGAWLNALADLMATEMRGAAEDAGTYTAFSDPRDNFIGKGICGNPESIHGIVLDKVEADDHTKGKPSVQSFHPKIGGARLYADSFEDTLRTIG